MNKIKFVKDYSANCGWFNMLIPQGTIIESYSDLYHYTHEESENQEGATFKSIASTDFTKDEIDELIRRGFVVKVVSQEEYEDELYKKAISNKTFFDENEKLKVENGQLRSENETLTDIALHNNAVNSRMDKLRTRYNNRLAELRSKNNTKQFYPNIDTEIRAYVCESILDAIDYIADNGKYNK